MARRMTPEQRARWRDLRAGIARVDAVFRRLADQVRRILAQYTAAPLTTDTRRAILRALDGILAPVFGLTRRAAQTAELTNLILRMSANASEGVWRRAYDRLARIVERRDPALWQRVRLSALVTPNPRGLASVIAMFEGPAVTAQRLRVARFVDPARTWVDPNGYRLSDRVWQSGRGVRRAIDDRLRLAIRRGDDPIRVARELERYLDPAWQPLRYGADGRIVVDRSRKQVYTNKPRGGHGSNAARRLARTEIIGAHGRATIESARDVPGVIGIRWMLSNAHPEADECTDIANRDVGLGRGVYPVDDVPSFPRHPNELCSLSHEHVSRQETIDIISAQYGS